MKKLLRFSDDQFENLFEKALLQRQTMTLGVDDQVREIIEQVRALGDQALIEYTEKFDGVRFLEKHLMVPEQEIKSCYNSCDKDDLAALEFAAARIEAFHRRQVPTGFSYTDDAGVTLGTRWSPLQSVGIYVPGGQALYPSSLLMNAIPARIAGVGRLVMVVPCPRGDISPYLLAAARISGVEEIYKVGGAQAIAALAYGTGTIAPVDKIVGPGNAFVAAAKRQVFGSVGIDSIAGPSEILVVADGRTKASWIAIDLLSQAEHDADAQCTLITDDLALAKEVENEIEKCLSTLERAQIARSSWKRNGIIILVDRLEDAPGIINRIAPEHVELAVECPENLSDAIHNAGAIFVGSYTPEAIGDYVAGPNHVLPTARSSRFASGLSVLDFCKCTNLIKCDNPSLQIIGPSAITLAKREGLDAHARSIAIRLADT